MTSNERVFNYFKTKEEIYSDMCRFSILLLGSNIRHFLPYKLDNLAIRKISPNVKLIKKKGSKYD